MASIPRPAFDPSLEGALKQFPDLPPFTKDNVQGIRDGLAALSSAETTLTNPKVSHEELTIPGPNGDIVLLVLQSRNSAGKDRPAIYYMHGGGMCIGNRFMVNGIIDWTVKLDAVIVSVEYRLAPENVHPAPVEDCYAGLQWVAENSERLGVDREKIVIAGHSGGGGLAAAVGLLSRDRGGAKVYAQMLGYPMLDDRTDSYSAKQFATSGTWSSKNNTAAWDLVLDGKRGDKNVSIYAAPGRATDLSGLPPTWIDVGSAETFRDECIAYANKMWEAGMACELHVWPGGWHAFDVFAMGTRLSDICMATRLDWMQRTLFPKGMPKHLQ